MVRLVVEPLSLFVCRRLSAALKQRLSAAAFYAVSSLLFRSCLFFVRSVRAMTDFESYVFYSTYR